MTAQWLAEHTHEDGRRCRAYAYPNDAVKWLFKDGPYIDVCDREHPEGITA